MTPGTPPSVLFSPRASRKRAWRILVRRQPSASNRRLDSRDRSAEAQVERGDVPRFIKPSNLLDQQPKVALRPRFSLVLQPHVYCSRDHSLTLLHFATNTSCLALGSRLETSTSCLQDWRPVAGDRAALNMLWYVESSDPSFTEQTERNIYFNLQGARLSTNYGAHALYRAVICSSFCAWRSLVDTPAHLSWHHNPRLSTLPPFARAYRMNARCCVA